ncbi:MAG: DJ-1/PfpI family protein [Synechococcaceae cyanobacterium SM2_3_60]|nr:DJ-1/PfpI family protein [Synechococcaceae cyanobacterium SM2_3_60]
MPSIHILVFDGFDELDALAPFEVLQTAVGYGAPFEVALVSAAAAVTAAHGLVVVPSQTPDTRPAYAIVPGGGWSNRAAQGAWAEAQRGEVAALLTEWHGAGTLIASVCTGAMLVAATGLLKGKQATTHHAAWADLAAAGVICQQARVVDIGQIITASGVTAGLDLALWLIERLVGASLALQVEQELEYERRGTVWRL